MRNFLGKRDGRKMNESNFPQKMVETESRKKNELSAVNVGKMRIQGKR